MSTMTDREAAIQAAVERKLIEHDAAVLMRLETNPPPVFTSVSSVDDCALAPDKLAFLVDQLCPMGSIPLFTSTAKAGKTTFLQNLGLAIAKGERQFLGFDLVRDYARSVLYVNLDESPETFRQNVKRLGPHERFRHIHLPGGRIDLSLPTHVAALAETCIADDIGVLVLDVFTSAFSGDDNVNADVIAAWNGIQALRVDANLDVIFVAHHSGKGEAQKGKPRGASAFSGKADALWEYVERGKLSYFRTSKARGAKSIGEFLVHYDDETHRITRGKSRAEERASASTETEAGISDRILAFVTMNPGANGGEIQTGVAPAGREVVKRIRDEHVASGKLIETPVPGSSTGKAYHIGSL
jgi:AAA domain